MMMEILKVVPQVFERTTIPVNKLKEQSMSEKRATTPMVLTSTLLKIPLASFTA